VDHFLERRGRSAARFLKAVSYERLLHARRVPRGHYIFADLERLTPREAELAARVWAALSSSGLGCRLFNHPTRALRRYELLRRLCELGINRAGVYRLTEARWPSHYPVFIRRENDHAGSRTQLLRDAGELRAAIDELEGSGTSRDDLLVCEFRDTAGKDGVYTKYAAFLVDGRVIPRHVFFHKNWLVKGAGLVDERWIEIERRHLEENPHEDRLREIFALSRVDYGRIDYSLRDGEIEVWEINTHPTLPKFPGAGGAARESINAGFARRLVAALEEIDRQPLAKGRGVPVDLPRRRWLLRSTRKRMRRGLKRVRGALIRRQPRA
jgi:hypothetical protein